MCQWSAITGLGAPHLDNSTPFHVVSQPPFSDKGREEQQGEQRIQALEALAHNWHVFISSTFCWPKELKAIQDCPAIFSYADHLNPHPNPNPNPHPNFNPDLNLNPNPNSLSLPGQDLICCQNSIWLIPFLTPPISPQLLVPPVSLSLALGWRNRRFWLAEFWSHLVMDMNTGKNENYGAIFCKPSTTENNWKVRPNLSYGLWPLFFLWSLFT